jgi:hypothetical protein
MKLGPAKSSLSRNESKYDSTHGYVAPDQTDRFVASFIATFGGIEQAGPQGVGRGNTTFLFLALRALRPRRRGEARASGTVLHLNCAPKKRYQIKALHGLQRRWR